MTSCTVVGEKNFTFEVQAQVVQFIASPNENHSCFLNRKGEVGTGCVCACPDTFTGTVGKMAAPSLLLLLLLVFSAGALLPSSEAQRSAYSELSLSLKRGVDLALEKLHSHAAIQQHLVFFRSLSTSEIQVPSTG